MAKVMPVLFGIHLAVPIKIVSRILLKKGAHALFLPDYPPEGPPKSGKPDGGKTREAVPVLA
jgi:hypothetical protein